MNKHVKLNIIDSLYFTHVRERKKYIRLGRYTITIIVIVM